MVGQMTSDVLTRAVDRDGLIERMVAVSRAVGDRAPRTAAPVPPAGTPSPDPAPPLIPLARRPTDQLAPAGPAALAELARLTDRLAVAQDDPGHELARFRDIRTRGLRLPHDRLADWLAGRTVLVTGGTGCIGTTLLAALRRYRPRAMVSVSRGMCTRPRLDGVRYLHADLADGDRVRALVERMRPDVVFNLAGQRNPALAEREVTATVAVNVVGLANIVAACAAAGVTALVHASTGKALRPFSGDVYAASKRVGEWILSSGPARRAGLSVSAGRFTHVVDNSIVHGRLEYWCDRDVMRLHAPRIGFFAQSARESAQLLLCAGLAAVDGSPSILAIRDFGWPVSLLDLALDVRRARGGRAAVLFTGYERGYEDTPYPGLYDPRYAGDVSPLISALEAPGVTAPGCCPQLDAFAVPAPAGDPARERTEELARARYDELAGALLDGGQPGPGGQGVRAGSGEAGMAGRLRALSEAVLEVSLAGTPPATLRRIAGLTLRHSAGMSGENSWLDSRLNAWARDPGAVPAARG
jgi:nucleoside-diphosphate-sugar epimerase